MDETRKMGPLDQQLLYLRYPSGVFYSITKFPYGFVKAHRPRSFLVPYFVVSYLLFWVMLPKSPHRIRLYYALGTTGACLLFFLLFMLLMFTIMLISALLFDSFSMEAIDILH
ncbi:hypothetical protein ABN702_22385 [Bacillus haimaensis]|uniref:hypothetical protein n=1 Tax=Bacillus haimaensis TaxID=3160967 RepID=UPI003AA97798